MRHYHHYRQKKSTNKGFTLIEVMAALAVVAVGISAAVGVVNSMGVNIAKLEDRAVSQWIVSNRLVERRLEQFQVESPQALLSNNSSTLTMGAREWHVFDTSKLSDITNMVETSVEVCLDSAKNACVFEQSFYLIPLAYDLGAL